MLRDVAYRDGLGLVIGALSLPLYADGSLRSWKRTKNVISMSLHTSKERPPMANEHALYMRHVHGIECFDKFVALLRSTGVPWSYFHLATNIPNLNFALETQDVLQAISQPKQKKVLDAMASTPGIDCVRLVARIGGGNGPQVEYDTDDMFVGRITLKSQDGQWEQLVRVCRVAPAHFSIVPRGELLLSLLPEEERAPLKQWEFTAAELTDAVKQLGVIAAEQIARAQLTLEEKIADLEKAYESKRAVLEDGIAEREKTLEAKYAAQAQSLTEREEQLKKERAEYDLRANTAVRRDLFEQVKRELAEHAEASVSELTLKKRTPVHAVCIMGLLLFGSAAAVQIWRITAKPDAAEQHSIWALGAATIGFGGLLIFYLRFLYQWFAELAATEFTTQKLRNDFLRASWLAELVLESKGQTKELPTELLLQYTRNLFTDFDWKHRVQHPMEQAMDILGRAKKAKISPTEGIEVSR